MESDWADAAEHVSPTPKEPAGLALSEAALAHTARAESVRAMRPTWLAIQASWRRGNR